MMLCTYLPTHPPTHPPTYLPTFVPTYLSLHSSIHTTQRPVAQSASRYKGKAHKTSFSTARLPDGIWTQDQPSRSTTTRTSGWSLMDTRCGYLLTWLRAQLLKSTAIHRTIHITVTCLFPVACPTALRYFDVVSSNIFLIRVNGCLTSSSYAR